MLAWGTPIGGKPIWEKQRGSQHKSLLRLRGRQRLGPASLTGRPSLAPCFYLTDGLLPIKSRGETSRLVAMIGAGHQRTSWRAFGSRHAVAYAGLGQQDARVVRMLFDLLAQLADEKRGNTLAVFRNVASLQPLDPRRVDISRSAAPRRLDRRDVDFLHLHHRLERALCFGAAGRHRLGQHARRDLPGDAPSVLAPAARALLSAIAHDGVPVAVGLLLIVGGDLEREGFVVLEHGTAVEADAGYSGDREFDHQHVALLAGRVVTGCTADGSHRAVRKGRGVKAGGSLGVLVVPDADRVLCHGMSFCLEPNSRLVSH